MQQDESTIMRPAHRVDALSTVMPADDIQILRSVREEIRSHLAPLARSTTALAAARMVDNMLAHVIVGKTTQPDRAWLEARRTLLIDMVDHLTAPDRTDADLYREAETLALLDIPSLSPDDYAAAGRRIDAALEHCVAAILRPGMVTDAQPLIQRLLDSGQTALAGRNDATQNESTAYGALREATMSPLTPQRIEACLRHRFADRPDIRVLDMQALAGGFSKSTTMVRLAGLEDGETEIVIKRDMNASATETSVVDEYPVVHSLWTRGFAVPEPLWLEPDPAGLGFPFMAMRKARGEIGGSLWQQSDACNRQTGLDIAGFLGRLHALDPSGIDLGPSIDAALDPREQELRVVADLREGWARKKQAPDPQIEAALCWMENNQPEPPPRVSILHSDIGFHNMLLVDDRLSVVLDWEMVQLGNAASNLIYIRPQVENVMPWADFMAEYIRHGGMPYDERTEVYYRTWRHVRSAIGAAYTGHAFASDRNLELRMGHTGIIDFPVLSLMSAEVVGTANISGEAP